MEQNESWKMILWTGWQRRGGILHNSGLLPFLSDRSNISITYERYSTCSISGFSRGRFETNKKKHENTKTFEERWDEGKKKRVENYSSRNENWWGEKRRTKTMNAKTRSSLVHPKIYFIPVVVVEHLGNSRAFWFAFSTKQARRNSFGERAASHPKCSNVRTFIVHTNRSRLWNSCFFEKCKFFAWLKTMLYLDDVLNCSHVETILFMLSPQTRLHTQFFTRHDKCFSCIT